MTHISLAGLEHAEHVHIPSLADVADCHALDSPPEARLSSRSREPVLQAVAMVRRLAGPTALSPDGTVDRRARR